MKEPEIMTLLIGAGDRSKLKFIKFIIEQLKPLADERADGILVLDCGCGIGEVSALLGRLGYKVIGVDVHRPSIDDAITRNTYPNVEFLCQDAITIDSPYRFDAVICSEVICN